jgi:hypothetical protein
MLVTFDYLKEAAPLLRSNSRQGKDHVSAITKCRTEIKPPPGERLAAKAGKNTAPSLSRRLPFIATSRAASPPAIAKISTGRFYGSQRSNRVLISHDAITNMLSFSVPPGYRRRERPASRKLRPSMAWIDAILECDSRVLRYLCMLKTPKGREGVEILRRQRPGQLRLFSTDQLLWVWLYWRWRSRHLGRPLIRRMSLANPLWGAPASTELLKLSIDGCLEIHWTTGAFTKCIDPAYACPSHKNTGKKTRPVFPAGSSTGRWAGGHRRRPG